MGPQLVFLGCDFAAKYPEGGGNFSVPLQWALGLKKLEIKFIWLEVLFGCGDPMRDQRRIRIFRRRMREAGLEANYCLLFWRDESEVCRELNKVSCYGMDTQRFRKFLEVPHTLLNLCYSIRPPLLNHFNNRVLCDLDPGEIPYWMKDLELGQSSHQEFWTIGLNINGSGCRLPKQSVSWRTFFPLVDTELNRLMPRPLKPKFTTVGQWYWKNDMLIDGQWRDFSKQATFKKFLDLPRRVPQARMELAMNMTANDPAKGQLEHLGWKVRDPHRVAKSPKTYRKYLSEAIAEFTAVKGIDTYLQTGWISDRAATFLAMGRPVITENTGASLYLPQDSGMLFVANVEEAAEAVGRVLQDWDHLSQMSRECAVKYFDATKTLQRILGAS
ncbi:MAG: hypothetical protein C5B47_01805 [Verrucomicrobia bacterium]|nr:MAG: hypothetical protein C5B47_01805 [Verrucomicrobiota bacterium]